MNTNRMIINGWRWIGVLMLLLSALLQPASAQAEGEEMEAAGDSGWYISTIHKGATQGKASMPSLAIHPVTGKAFVSYYDEEENSLHLMYEQENGNCGAQNDWQCVNFDAVGIPNNGGDYNSLDFDPNGTMYLLYTNNKALSKHQLKGITWSGADISKATYSELLGGDETIHAPLVKWVPVISNMAVLYHIDYFGGSAAGTGNTSRIIFQAWPGQNTSVYWSIDARFEQDTYSTNGFHSAIDISHDGFPYYSYRGETAENELWISRVATKNTNCLQEEHLKEVSATYDYEWTCTRLDPTNFTGFFTSIYAPKAAGDTVRVSYMDREQGNLKFAENVGGNGNCGTDGATGWRCIVIDSIGAEGRGTQVFVQNGKAVIVYHDANDGSNEKLKIARQLAAGESGNCGPSDGFFKTWQCGVIDSGVRPGEANKNVGRRVSAKMDKNGRIVAVYTTTDGDLVIAKERFTQQVTLTKSTVQSLAVGTSSGIYYQFQNPNPEALTELFFYDRSANRVTFSEATSNCGGTVELLSTGLAGPRLQIKGGKIAALGTCTISAKITGLTEGIWDYSTSQVTTREALPGASVVVPVTIYTPKQTQSINFAPLSDKTLSDTPFTVNATASSGLPVTFGSTTPGVCTVNTATVALLAGGTCTLVAAQAGDAQYDAAASVSRSFTVQAAANGNDQQAQSITFAALPNRTLGDAPFVLSATASSGLPVGFVSNTPAVCTVDNAGVVTLIGSGGCTLVASQSGNAVFNPAPSITQSFTVNPSATLQYVFLPIVTR